MARTLEAVTTMGGLRVVPDLLLEELRPSQSAMLILPGGVAWNEKENADAIEVARAFLEAWYLLFKTGDATHFRTLAASLPEGRN